ncbi:MAG: hypothetical protein WD045_06580 [Pirellulaceae bacterium]
MSPRPENRPGTGQPPGRPGSVSARTRGAGRYLTVTYEAPWVARIWAGILLAMLALPLLLMLVGQAAAIAAILLPIMFGMVLAFLAWWIALPRQISRTVLGIITAVLLAGAIWFNQQFGLYLLGLAGGSLMYWARARVYRISSWCWAKVIRMYRGWKIRRR